MDLIFLSDLFPRCFKFVYHLPLSHFICFHVLRLKILPCGWFPRMKSLLCKCRSRVWILGTHVKSRQETENSGGRHGRSLRRSDCLNPPKSVNSGFSRRPRPNKWSAEHQRKISHINCRPPGAYAPAHMWACIRVYIPHNHTKTQTRHTYRETNTALSSYGLQTSVVLAPSSSVMNFCPICHIACSLYHFTLWGYYWVLFRFLSQCTSFGICPFKARGGPSR